MQLTVQEKEKQEILKRYRNLLRVWKPVNPDDKKIVRKAFNLAADAHKDMRRKSGEPYIYHPIETATIVAGEIGLGKQAIIAALLHDVVEDTEMTLPEIEGLFGKKVAAIIDGLTKIKDIFEQNTPSLQAENFRKILLTLSDDVRVILIKLADRLHNMRTLDALVREKQLKIASETMFLFVPLANRLGLYAIKSEMEDLAMKYTEPEIYETISQKLKESERERSRHISKFIYPLKKTLSSSELDYEIFGRVKSIYSIWQKMKKKEIPFEEVFDIFAIRIILDTLPEKEKAECWRVYSIITGIYKPRFDRLRDWISIPKANGYEALHTTVMSHAGKWVEIQIRSKRMDEIAEKGYAAHWKYKEEAPQDTGLDEWLNKIRELLKNPDSDALDFLSDFQLNLFQDEIYIFTPKGEMKSMPKNSTVIDFAYNIHTQIGNQCIGAKVNHKLVSLNHELKSGDQVEIITSKKQKPKEDWLRYAHTARAVARIKDQLKEDRKKYYSRGEQKLKEIFNQLNIEYNNTQLKKIQEKNDIKSLIDLFYYVTAGRIGSKEVKACCHDNEKLHLIDYLTRPFTRSRLQAEKSLAEILAKQIKNKPETLVLGNRVDKIQYNISKCCNPIPGDNVIGIIKPKGGIEIHRINCREAIKLMSRFEQRIVKAKWRKNETEIEFLAGIKIQGTDRKGIINEVVNNLSGEHRINMRSLHVDSSEGLFEGKIMVYVYNTNQLKNILANLKKIKGIQKATRLSLLNGQ